MYKIQIEQERMANYVDPRIVAQFNARSPFKLQDAELVTLMRVGSHAHGTYIPPGDPNAVDDVDYMGIVIPPPEFTLGLKRWENTNFQHEELDCVFYSFQKFVQLLVKSNPNVIGLLWQDEQDAVWYTSQWLDLVQKRHLFSSLRAYPAFIGYAHGQMEKMTAFGPEQQAEFDYHVAVVTTAGWTVEQVVNKEHREMPNVTALKALYPSDYPNDGAVAAWANGHADALVSLWAKYHAGYMGEKRKRLVRKYGYDTKGAAHLIRLLYMCVDFLSTGRLVVRRPEADYLRRIKQGEYTLDEIKQRAQELFDQAERVKATSSLPAEPDEEKINQLVVQSYLDSYRSA